MPSSPILPPPSRGREKVAAAVLEWLCLAGANWFVFAFIYIAASSLSYPFSLEWMEGQSVDIIQRIVNGLPVYTKPSIEYVSYIYTPLYFYVSALVAEITGIGFLPARLVSTLSALGVGAIIYLWIRRENGSWQQALITAGLYFSTYALSARWFDVARIDSLFLALTLGGMYVFYFYTGFYGALGTALLLSAAFFTKQSAIIAVAPALACGFFLNRKRTGLTIGLLILFICGGIALGNIVSDGWFGFYIFDVPAGHSLDRRYIYSFWTENMFRQVGVYIGLSLAALAYYGRTNFPKGLSYAALMAGFVGASYAMRLHWGGWLNVLMPAHAVLAMLSGLALVALSNNRLSFLAYGLVALQMAALLYNPIKFIPTQADVERGNRFLNEISLIKGDIFAPELQFVQTRAGKKSYSFGMAGYDVLRADLGKKNYVKEELAKELREAIVNQRFGGVFDGRLIRLPAMAGNYRFSRHIDYPKEYITDAINFFRGDLSVPVPRKKELP